jgi:hypothetical protein
MVYMKATIDIPDDLYRRVKAKSAMEGLAVREVAVSLFSTWIGETPSAATQGQETAGGTVTPAWFGSARGYARSVARHDMASIRRSIVTGRRHETAAPSGEPEKTP